MPDVRSSALLHVDYDSRRAALFVTFVTRLTYRYDGVPAHIYEALLVAPSKGTFFNQNVRDRYATTLVERPAHGSPKRSPTSTSSPGGSSRRIPSERMRVSTRLPAPRR